jgi:AraC-like DNA-binding protein
MSSKKESDNNLMADLRRLIGRFAGREHALQALPGVMVVASSVPTPPFAHVAEATFALVAQGAKRVVLGDKVFDYAAGQYLVVSVHLPVSAHIVRASAKEPFLGFGLALQADAIASLLLEASAVPKTQGEPPGIAVSELTNDLLDPVVRLLRPLDRPADIPVLASTIKREILWRLINEGQGAMVRQLGLADSRMAQISRAIKWIRCHYAEAVRIDDLADVASMSVTSLHRHFLALTSLSPMQYQKRIRLPEARSRLLSRSEDVAAVGFSVGYESPSQFS